MPKTDEQDKSVEELVAENRALRSVIVGLLRDIKRATAAMKEACEYLRTKR